MAWSPVAGPQRGGGVSPPQAPVGVSAAGLARVSLCPRLGAAPRAAPPPCESCHLVPDWSPEKEGPSGVSPRPGRSGQGSGSAGCVPLPSILSPPWTYSVSWGLRRTLWLRAICRAPTWCQAGSGVGVGQVRWVTTTFSCSPALLPLDLGRAEPPTPTPRGAQSAIATVTVCQSSPATLCTVISFSAHTCARWVLRDDVSCFRRGQPQVELVTLRLMKGKFHAPPRSPALICICIFVFFPSNPLSQQYEARAP